MLVIPENYREMGELWKLAPHELEFAELLQAAFPENDAFLLVKVMPASVSTDFCLIHRTLGVFFIFTKTLGSKGPAAAARVYAEKIDPQSFEEIRGRFCSHPQLTAEGRGADCAVPAVPFGLLYYFPQASKRDAAAIRTMKGAAAPGAEDAAPFGERCLFRHEMREAAERPQELMERLRQVRSYGRDSFVLTDELLNALHYAVVPEYRIPKFEDVQVRQELNDWNLPLDHPIRIACSQGDRELKALALTEEQVELVNALPAGPSLLLSCAGSGKSVLLAARAIKVAKTFPDRKVLLTCYNRSLQSYLEACIDAAGLAERNLVCKSFHQLCVHLLQSNGLPLPNSRSDERFNEELVERVSRILREEREKIQERFFAVFVDEIQDFEQEWYRICVELLEDRHFYILNIAGDGTQDLYDRLLHGIPWVGSGLPDCKAASAALRKNFRATEEIHTFVAAYCEAAASYYRNVRAEPDLGPTGFTAGTPTGKRGPKPEVFWVDSLGAETEKVADLIQQLHRNGVAYQDIAVLFPYSRSPQGSHYPVFYAEKALSERGIPYFCPMEEKWKGIDFGDRPGVALSTVYSAKGVDFRAVIVSGISKLWPQWVRRSFDAQQRRRLGKNLRLIYTAVTRAEEYLYITMLTSSRSSAYGKILASAEEAVRQRFGRDLI